jgi:hypothetical protein
MDIPDLTFLIRRSQGGDRIAGAKLFDLAYPFLKADRRSLASRRLDGTSACAAGSDSRRLADEDLFPAGCN